MDRSALQVADLSRARAVEETVSKKRLRCPCAAQHTDEEDGCDWVGMVRERQTHIDTECGYTSVPCPHNGCEVRVQRRAVEEHAASCEQRVEACEHCGEGGVVSQRAQHEQVCPQVAVECPFKEVGCTAPSMLRKDVAAHEAEAGQKHATLALAAQKEGRERARAHEAAALALRTEAAEEATRLQAAETAAADHEKERQELVKRATKAEDRCRNIVVTDTWVIDRVVESLSQECSATHRVSLSQEKGEKTTVTITAYVDPRGQFAFSVLGAYRPSVSVLLHNASAMDEPLELASTSYRGMYVNLPTLRKKYLTGDGCLTLTTTLHGT